MKHKRNGLGLVVTLAVALVLIPGCQQNQTAQGATPETSAGLVASTANIDISFNARDWEAGYEEAAATHIQLNGDSVAIEGDGAAFSQGILTISAAGTYVLSGSLTDGQVLVAAADSDQIQLVCNGVTLHCEDNAPLYIKSADQVFLTLAAGTENTVSDGDAYQLAEEDSTVDAAIFSKADLTINGSGALTVIGHYQHGIVSKDDLVITGGELNVTAAGHGLVGKDCLKIAGGVFRITAAKDGLQSDNSEDLTRGFIYICGGDFQITAGNDGIQAETVLRIDDGNLAITAGGGSAQVSQGLRQEQQQERQQEHRPSGTRRTAEEEAADLSFQPNQAATSEENTPSTKGLKAGNELIINGGSLTVDAADDSLHTNGSATIAGGLLQLSTGDDGLHADGGVTMQGGEMTIAVSYEGVEGESITITGGTLAITASDDGINAAGDGPPAIPGQKGGGAETTPAPAGERATNDAVFIRISGGEIHIDAGGDGMDSNGDLYVEGGTLFIDGPTSNLDGALDYEGTAEISGGVIVAVGSNGMAQAFSTSSAQCSLLYDLHTTVAAGQTVTLRDGGGQEIIAYTPQKAYQTVLISTPALVQGETYTLTAGEETAEITLNEVVTSNGAGFGGRGGGRDGDPQPSSAQNPPGQPAHGNAGGQQPPDDFVPQDENQPTAP